MQNDKKQKYTINYMNFALHMVILAASMMAITLFPYIICAYVLVGVMVKWHYVQVWLPIKEPIKSKKGDRNG